MLELRDFSISLGGQALVNVPEFSVQPGQVVTLLGPSGAGKSTLLNAILGTLDPAFSCKGQILVAAARVEGLPAHRRGIGLVEQRPTLFAHMNVGQNLAYGLRSAVRGRKARLAAIEEALEQANLPGLAARDVAGLSGGQAARISLFRTLLSAPNALLLDEPFAALDPALRADMRAVVFGQVRARGLPCLLVTHDEADAAQAGGPVFALENNRLTAQQAR